jgi:hypothetical protein
MPKESKAHLLLKEKAKSELIERGFGDSEIYTEYRIGPFIVDVAGIKGEIKIAIEVGTLSKDSKLIELEEFFDKVIHFPYGKRKTKIIEIEDAHHKAIKTLAGLKGIGIREYINDKILPLAFKQMPDLIEAIIKTGEFTEEEIEIIRGGEKKIRTS